MRHLMIFAAFLVELKAQNFVNRFRFNWLTDKQKNWFYLLLAQLRLLLYIPK